ncbi:MAG: hypothetical protein LBQ93_06135 [Treponema sp.]|jgi:hypothetical protein|nr:hypothetical protein [Treponema sp.]
MSNRQIDKGKAAATIITMLLLLGLVMASMGCGERSALLGRWEEIKEETSTAQFLEFFPDGTVDLDGLTVEWKAKKGKLMLSAFGITQTVNYNISGSTLTLADDDGLETKFKKLK